MDTLDNLELLIKSFNWQSPSWDLFIILFWLVAGLIYAFSSGRGRLLSILVSVYMAKLLVIEAPFLNQLVNEKFNIVTLSLRQLATFAVLFMVLFFSLSKYGFKTAAEGRGAGSLLFSVIFSVLQIGLLINIVLSFMPAHVQGSFSPLVTYLFIGPISSFVWLILPVVFLVVFGRFVSNRSEV